MHKLIKFACDELEELERKVAKEGSMSKSDLDYAKELSELKKNLLKGQMLEEESEYSNAMGGYSRRDYSRRMSYADNENYPNMDFVRPDGSYRDDGMSYARGRGRGAKRDAMGRYSSAEDEMIMQLERLMGTTSDEHTKSEIRKLIETM